MRYSPYWFQLPAILLAVLGGIVSLNAESRRNEFLFAFIGLGALALWAQREIERAVVRRDADAALQAKKANETLREALTTLVASQQADLARLPAAVRSVTDQLELQEQRQGRINKRHVQLVLDRARYLQSGIDQLGVRLTEEHARGKFKGAAKELDGIAEEIRVVFEPLFESAAFNGRFQREAWRLYGEEVLALREELRRLGISNESFETQVRIFATRPDSAAFFPDLFYKALRQVENLLASYVESSQSDRS